MANTSDNKKTKIPSPEELEAMMVVPVWAVKLGVVLLQLLIYGLPTLAVVLPLLHFQQTWLRVCWILSSPLIFSLLFGAVAGLLSRPWQAGIIKGVFPRDLRFPVYAMRRLYGICWTSVYYFKPVYNIILNIPLFKAVTFRLFGYKGSLNFTAYPDAWIRDLPLLHIEEGSYVSNRSTLGTNICTTDGFIIVGSVTLNSSMVGHLSMLGTGVVLGERSEIGVGCMIGLKTKIGNHSVIDPGCIISHKIRIGNNVLVGAGSFIGSGTTISDHIIIPPVSMIPAGVTINTQSDLDKFLNQPITDNSWPIPPPPADGASKS
jgi:carbonic anhydrase/acetyltransferase-like protein (isoleucine patch superfamily)